MGEGLFSKPNIRYLGYLEKIAAFLSISDLLQPLFTEVEQLIKIKGQRYIAFQTIDSYKINMNHVNLVNHKR